MCVGGGGGPQGTCTYPLGQNFFVTDRVRSTRKVMFWHVSVHPSFCLSTGVYPCQVHLRYPLSDLAGGVPCRGGYPCQGVPHLRYPPSQTWLGGPTPARGGTPPQVTDGSTWYTAVSIPLAFMQDFLVFMQFLGTIDQIVSWHPLWVGTPPLGNPGSATANTITTITWIMPH